MRSLGLIRDLGMHLRIVDFINESQEKEREIASEIYFKYWKFLKREHNDSFINSLGAVAIINMIILITFKESGAFPVGLESSYLSLIAILLMVLVLFIGLFLGSKNQKSWRRIDKMPILKQEFDKFMKNPLAQKILEDMKKLQND